MGLSSALFTGLSGLNVNQTQMNVVGNDIANVNTVAFKSSRAVFTPQFYVTDSAGSPPDAQFGGTNPSQRGLGATVATIQKDLTQGSIQPTGKATDMAINGAGFFVVNDTGAGQQYTRDGSFTLNGDHKLVTSTGAFVQGFGVDASGQVVTGKTQDISIQLGAATIAKATTSVTLSGNLASDGNVSSGASVVNSQDLITAGGLARPDAATPLTSLLSATTGTAAFTAGQQLKFQAKRGGNDVPVQTFNVSATSTVADLQTFFNNTLGIDTSVPGAGTQVVNGTAANSIDLSIVGNSGAANALTLPSAGFADAAGNNPLTLTANPTAIPVGESAPTTMTVYDSLGQPVTIDVTTVLQSKSDTGTTWKFYANSGQNLDPANPGKTLVGTGTLTFNAAGALTGVTGGSLAIHRSGTGAAAALPINLDFSGVSALAQDSAHTGSDVEMTSQDGIQIGTLTGFAVGGDGTITGSYDNGQTRALGQVAVATFNNPAGMDDQGGNMYAAAANSGVPVIAAPKRFGGGTIQSSALEQSNVDLSTEFTNMIIASTGFSAASKVITTSNQMLTDLLNSQR